MNRLKKDGFWHDFWSPSDELILEIGAFGEVLVAKIRAYICLCFVVLPIFTYFSGTREEFLISASVCSFAIIHSVAILYLYRKGIRYLWPKYLATVVDVSLVSLILWFLSLGAEPTAALNTRVASQIYLIVIITTVLRGDYRLTLLAGIVAALQYSLLIYYVMTFYPVTTDTSLHTLSYGHVNLGDQISRVILILVTTAIGVLIIRRHLRLVHLSFVDPLTGVFNRNYLDVRAKNQNLLLKGNISVMILDLDHFKKINDSFGHPVGDEVLRQFSKRLQNMSLISDVICRYGGEEFLIITKAESPESVLQRADHIRKLVESSQFEIDNETPVISLTVSIGIASMPIDGKCLESLIKVADSRLLAAKKDGRNRVYGTG